MNLKEKIAFGLIGATLLACLATLVVAFIMYPGDGLRVAGILSGAVLFIWACCIVTNYLIDLDGQDEE